MTLILSGSDGVSDIDGSASTPAIRGSDANTGIYFPAADNIGFATNGVIRGRWTTDGLCFGSDTAAANALDDYEEGTFTPTYEGTSTAGTTTYVIQTGYYTKIGNIVTVIINLGWSNATGTGVSVVKGLPFQSANLANNYAAVSIRNNGFAQSGGQLSAYVNINATDMRIGYSNLTTGADIDSNVDASVDRIMFQATYRAA